MARRHLGDRDPAAWTRAVRALSALIPKTHVDDLTRKTRVRAAARAAAHVVAVEEPARVLAADQTVVLPRARPEAVR